ncbi:serine/threonine protein phosphatase [Pleurocapsa sp. CCALA 161]|uniref:metallophosphoesterase family protein n=1 Tax=Pleurocapsa sp. CCALA 161 TaxID=2107688 RepID=UPI000D0576FC|nr:metallophosphoesterase family protein [Pleurocapsa sp. CCALA 161]PSB09658.1 serine/threonine protein phosphatase [Pleurocapsa sp. CCALA 161]
MHIVKPASMTKNRRIVIGDVHGHYDTLIALLDAVSPTSKDEIYFLGDLIDRGPKSAQVVDLVMRNKFHCLRGNHEEMLLDVVGTGEVSVDLYQSWLYSGGHATVDSYDSKIPQEHIDWIKGLPLYLDLGDYWLVHAGVDPNVPLAQQSAEQFCWIREDFHGNDQAIFKNKLIITGHTITFTLPGVKPGQIAAGKGWLDIETGAYHHNSGWMTAIDLNQHKVYQANSFDGRIRIMPLSKAIAKVESAKIASRRMRKRA